MRRLIAIVVAAATCLEEQDHQAKLLAVAKQLAEAFIAFMDACQKSIDKAGKGEKKVKSTAKAVAMSIAALINAAKEAADAAMVGYKALKSAATKIEKAKENLGSTQTGQVCGVYA